MQTRQTAEIVTRMDYWLSLPQGYDSPESHSQEASWPLIIFLHGAGERGNDLELVKKHGIPRILDQGHDLPAIAVSPQCPTGSWWSLEAYGLDALLDDLLARYRVDPRRIYLTGLNMGGYGTWSWALRRPETFAALVPIWAFHGAQDPVVPLEAQSSLVKVLRQAGSAIRFTVYPDAEHDSWTATYDNPELYTWMLAQSR